MSTRYFDDFKEGLILLGSQNIPEIKLLELKLNFKSMFAGKSVGFSEFNIELLENVS